MLKLAPKLSRYALASIGPAGNAGSQFLLSLILLHKLDLRSFGAISFLLVLMQFATSISSALFCAPLPAILARGQSQHERVSIKGIFAGGQLFAVASFPIFTTNALMLGLPISTSILLGCYVTLMLVRWFARAFSYANGTPYRTMLADATYALSALATLGATFWSEGGGATLIFAGLLVGTAASLIPFGRTFFAGQFGLYSRQDFAAYVRLWRTQTKWSLLGVFSTEATANSQAYLLTLVFGAASFAPIAASALFVRPLTVIINALAEYERPQMARLVAARLHEATLATAQFFRAALLMAWVAVLLLTLLVAIFDTGLLISPIYDRSTLFLGASLWLAVGLVRISRTPESILLQAASKFQSLALASMVSCGFSILGVLGLAAIAPVYSILGILLGQLVYAAVIRRDAADLLASLARPENATKA